MEAAFYAGGVLLIGVAGCYGAMVAVSGIIEGIERMLSMPHGSDDD